MRVKHEVGTLVKVNDELSFFFEREGVVSHFNHELFYNVYVRFTDDNAVCNFRHKELTAI